jgi:alkane 1-monooxygenase
VIGGTGMNFAHELIHRNARWERLMGEALLISTSYGHFATEHIYGHHLTVATPKDPVTARRREWFYTFLFRAMIGTALSAWALDSDRLARRGLPIWHPTNPFWRYVGGVALWLVLAYALAGWLGIGFFALQSFMAIISLEVVNYIEHYGLTREHLGNGKFERVQLHHSWNSAHKYSSWIMINLQRHSDHHHRPGRRFPVLQYHDPATAPPLPYDYAVMALLALLPPLFFYLMKDRLDFWRGQHYPHIVDWTDYDNGTIGRDRLDGAVIP